MEMIGRQPNTTIAVAHYYNYEKKSHRVQNSAWNNPTPLYENFHVYAMDTDAEPHGLVLRWRSVLRGERLALAARDAKGAPYDQPLFLILNLSVGGKWSGLPDASTKFPGALQVDYVRVYQKPDQIKGAPKLCSGHGVENAVTPLQNQTG